jgi:hypothetical protein
MPTHRLADGPDLMLILHTHRAAGRLIWEGRETCHRREATAAVRIYHGTLVAPASFHLEVQIDHLPADCVWRFRPSCPCGAPDAAFGADGQRM